MAKQTLGQFEKKAKKWAGKYPLATQKGLEKAADAVKKKARSNVRSMFKRQEGKLEEAIHRRVTKSPLAAWIFVGFNRQYRAYAHEYGPLTIRPKKKPYLVFETEEGSGIWVKTKQVTVPRRPFLRPALESERRKISRLIARAIRVKVFGGGK